MNTVFIFGTGPTTRVGPQLMTEKKVIIPGSYAGSLSSPMQVKKDVRYLTMNDSFQTTEFPESKTSPGWPYIFFPATDYSTAIRIAIQAIWNIAPGRVAFAHDTQQSCLYCVDPLAAGKSFIGSLQGMAIGRDLVYPQTSDPSMENAITTAVSAYFEAEVKQVLADPTYTPVTWVWAGNSEYSSVLLGKHAYAAQQMIDTHPKLPDNVKQKWKLRVMANNWGIGERSTEICGQACNHDNFYGLFPVPRYGDLATAQSMAELIALHDEYGAKDVTAAPPIPARKTSDYRDVRYVQGYTAALMWKLAVEAAVDAGHTSPTGEDIKNALESFKNATMSNMTAGPIAFSATDHRPQSTEVVYKLDESGQFAFVNHYSIELVPDWLGY